jgi:hypothetical protein
MENAMEVKIDSAIIMKKSIINFQKFHNVVQKSRFTKTKIEINFFSLKVVLSAYTESSPNHR